MNESASDGQRGGVGVAPRPDSPSSVSLLPTFERIAEMAALPADWDGEGAAPLSGRAIAAASLLIEAVAEAQERLTGERQAPWTSAPIADGGLQVEWLGRGARIDVQVAPNGTYGYMVKQGRGTNAEYQEASDIELDVLLGLIARVLAV